MAKEKLPSSGIDAYQEKFVGKSHRKSDKGPIKEKIPLIDSNTFSIFTSQFEMTLMILLYD